MTKVFVARGARVVVVDLQDEAGQSPTPRWPPPSSAPVPSTCW
ncbi:hypothetical protein [Streptomyces sp. NPDC058812]